MKQTQFKANITGTGKYLPKNILTNCDLEQLMNTSDEWIKSRTGIKERRQLDILEDRYITQGENEAARVAATREYYSVLASGNEGRIRIALQEALDTYRADTLRVNTDIAALEGMQLDQVRKMQTRNPEEYLNLRRQAEANYRRDLESGYYQGAGAGPSSTSQLQSEAAAIIGQ